MGKAWEHPEIRPCMYVATNIGSVVIVSSLIDYFHTALWS